MPPKFLRCRPSGFGASLEAKKLQRPPHLRRKRRGKQHDRAADLLFFRAVVLASEQPADRSSNELRPSPASRATVPSCPEKRVDGLWVPAKEPTGGGQGENPAGTGTRLQIKIGGFAIGEVTSVHRTFMSKAQYSTSFEPRPVPPSIGMCAATSGDAIAGPRITSEWHSTSWVARKL